MDYHFHRVLLFARGQHLCLFPNDPFLPAITKNAFCVCVHYTAISKEGQIHIFENVHLYYYIYVSTLDIIGIINEMKETTRMTKKLLDGSVKVAREWSGFGIRKCEVRDLV